MKKLATIVLLICPLLIVKAQKFDLIVTAEDSIACHIDSVNDIRVYFEMIIQSTWKQTSILKEKVLDYTYDTINKNRVVFIPGTSKIDHIISEELYNDIGGSHSHHYVFAPNAFPIEKGSRYYNSLFLYPMNGNLVLGTILV